MGHLQHVRGETIQCLLWASFVMVVVTTPNCTINLCGGAEARVRKQHLETAEYCKLRSNRHVSA